ncbi:cutinase family protein [Plantactinospora endophytica]|uniref:Cutinase n=1 Tax=Plantactinospora endophytica TaxID=673535 RepID=A0ABQ4DZS1_9ACTN|nr:cutinase family protein [Plantactinospora endophytica]GIG87930.1 cutinase [Plantactinospora endophytica]
MNGSKTRTRRPRLLAFVVAGAATVAGLAVASPTYAAQAPTNTCPQVEIIGARGSLQPPGLGINLTPLAQQITQQSPQTVRTTALNYPATLFNYAGSVRQGVTELQRVMAATAAKCADTRFVLTGYSQGANVIGDALVGGGLGGSSALTADLAARISSVLLFGDPTFTAGESFNVTDGRASGILPRRAGQLNAFADRIQSYCNANDQFCQNGSSSLAAHLDYRSYLGQATEFAVDRAGDD